MKRLTFTTILMIGLVCFGHKAAAQWELFPGILSQLTDDENNQFFGNLNGFENDWDIELNDLNNNLNGLFDAMGNPISGDTTGIHAGIFDLQDCLQNSGLSGFDQDTILSQVNIIDNLLDLNLDSLNNLFGQYQDSLGNNPNWDVQVIDYDNLTDNSYDILRDTFDRVINPNFPSNPGDIAQIIGKLFNEALFADLEIALGTQKSDLKYWSDEYSASAKVIRVGSVPRFDKVAIDCHDGIVRLPIEPRWHVEASWITGRIPTSINNSRGDEGNSVYDNYEDRQFNPLLLNGDFAMMATPVIGRLGNRTTFRLITSLGIEFGTYAPAHREYAPDFTRNNKGFATGFGPQFGSGFAATAGPLVIYSMGTITKGDVLHCALPYKYNSARFEAGIRYGNRVNLRYTTGKVSWQENDNRRAKINHQFTIGIILGALHN